MKTLKLKYVPDSVCNLLERIVPHRTEHSGSDDYRHQHQRQRRGLTTPGDRGRPCGDTIDLGVTGTITLTTGELLVNKSVTINGPVWITDIDGNHATRVFHVSGGVTATIDGLTITNGQASGFSHSDGGGGIYNDQSTLTVSNCTLSGNSAHAGGGIFNDAYLGSATLEVTSSTLSGNSSGGGGGIFNEVTPAAQHCKSLTAP